MKKGFDMSRPEVRQLRLFKRLMIIFAVFTVLFGGALAYIVYENFNYLAFKVIIVGNYVFTDTLDALYKETVGEVPVSNSEGKKNYFKNFDDVVISVVSSKIRAVGGDGENRDNYTYLYTPTQYVLSKEVTKTTANEATLREINTDTVYINVPNISPYTKKFINEMKDYMKMYKNLIIDLRSNPGGTLDDLYDICDLFLENGMIIGREVTRFPMLSKTVTARGEKYLNFESITILQNGGTASAAEGFVMALRENLSNVTVVGEKSFGKGIGQFTLPVKGGFAVKATTLRIRTPLDNSIHGVGIIPNIEYAEDDIIDFAVGLLPEETEGESPLP